MFQVTASALSDTWTGSLADLIAQNPGMPDFCVRRLGTLREGDAVRFPFGEHLFTFRRLTPKDPDLD